MLHQHNQPQHTTYVWIGAGPWPSVEAGGQRQEPNIHFNIVLVRCFRAAVNSFTHDLSGGLVHALRAAVAARLFVGRRSQASIPTKRSFNHRSTANEFLKEDEKIALISCQGLLLGSYSPEEIVVPCSWYRFPWESGTSSPSSAV